MWFNPYWQASRGRAESAGAAVYMSAMGTIVEPSSFCVGLSMVIALCFKETSKEMVGCYDQVPVALLLGVRAF